MSSLDSLTENISRILRLHGFKYVFKTIKEINLTGSLNNVLLIHASSLDEKTILTIRITGEGQNRLRISIRDASENLKEKIEKLENKGFNIYDDENELSIIGRFNVNELVNALTEVMKIVD